MKHQLRVTDNFFITVQDYPSSGILARSPILNQETTPAKEEWYLTAEHGLCCQSALVAAEGLVKKGLKGKKHPIYTPYRSWKEFCNETTCQATLQSTTREHKTLLIVSSFPNRKFSKPLEMDYE